MCPCHIYNILNKNKENKVWIKKTLLHKLKSYVTVLKVSKKS